MKTVKDIEIIFWSLSREYFFITLRHASIYLSNPSATGWM